MPTPSRLPRPAQPYRVRLEIAAADAARLRRAAADAGLSIASFARRVMLRELDRLDRHRTTQEREGDG